MKNKPSKKNFKQLKKKKKSKSLGKIVKYQFEDLKVYACCCTNTSCTTGASDPYTL